MPFLPPNQQRQSTEQDMNSKYGKKVVLAIQWQATENTYSK